MTWTTRRSTASSSRPASTSSTTRAGDLIAKCTFIAMWRAAWRRALSTAAETPAVPSVELVLEVGDARDFIDSQPPNYRPKIAQI